jgi:hypothetical protein
MTSEKGIYWIAVGVLALIVSNSATSNFGAKHEFASQLADRSMAAAQRLACRGSQYLATLETFVGAQQHSESPRVEMAMMRAQTKLASLQTMVASEQNGLAQLQCTKARLINRQNFVVQKTIRKEMVRQEIAGQEMARKALLLQNLKHATMLLPQQNIKIEVSDDSDTAEDGSL